MIALSLAHLVTTGLGPIYDGIGHLMVSPGDLLPVLAISLLAGLRGPAAGRVTLFILPAAWLVGGMVGVGITQPTRFPIECISFLFLGILVASDLRLPPNIVAAMAGIMGLMHGYLNGVAMSAEDWQVAMLELVGVASSLFVIVALVSAFVLWLRWDWTRIVVRVAGSWIAAAGLLWLGWAIRTANS